MISQIKRFLTAGGRIIEQTPPTPKPTIIALNGGKSGYQTLAEYQAATGDFNHKFAALPYLKGYWRAGIFTCVQPPLISKSVVDAIISRAGGLNNLLTQDSRAHLEDVRARFRDLNQKLEECSWRNTRAIFLAQSENASLKPGGKVDLAALASEAQIDEQISAARAGLHKNIQNLCAETFKILEPICIKARDTARDMAIELDDDERETAGKFGVPFVPSQQLCAIIFFAVAKAMQPVDNFTAGSGWLSPDTDLESNWRSGTVDPDAPKPAKPARGMVLSGTAGGYIEKPIRRQLEEQRLVQSTADEQKARARQLEEINAFNDQIRNQPPK